MDWIVIASQTEARVYKRRPYSSAMTLVHQLENPKGRLKNGEMDSDRPGRGFSPADARRHGYMVSIPPDQKACMDFAHKIASKLDAGRNQNSYDDLILVADPAMIGLIRDSIADQTLHLVREVVTKNFSRIALHELPTRLRDSFDRIDRQRPLRGVG